MGMFFITLVGKTAKGKNVVSNLGNLWVVNKIGNPLCFDGEQAFWCEPHQEMHKNSPRDHSRWVKTEDNVEFDLTFGSQTT